MSWISKKSREKARTAILKVAIEIQFQNTNNVNKTNSRWQPRPQPLEVRTTRIFCCSSLKEIRRVTQSMSVEPTDSS